MEISSVQLFSTGISRFAEILYWPGASENHFRAFRDALSHGQLQSKVHILKLVQDLNIHSKRALFIGHWHGFLPYLFLSSNLIDSGFGIEIDPFWKRVSENVCREYNWKSTIQDATELDPYFFEIENIDLVVNTSCEHMSFDWMRAVPSGVHVIAQANNYKIPEHTNLQGSVEEFKRNLMLSNYIHCDSIDFGIYKRFTVVGRK